MTILRINRARVPQAAFLLVLLLVSGCSLVGARTLENDPHDRIECPVSIGDLPGRVDPGDLQNVRLVSSDERVQNIEILRDMGFYAIEAGSAAGEPFQGTYRMATARTMRWDLDLGLGAVQWDSVAEPSDELRSDVKPGIYRFVLAYVAPRGEYPAPASEDQGEETRVPVCLYVSAPFELTESFTLFRFE